MSKITRIAKQDIANTIPKKTKGSKDRYNVNLSDIFNARSKRLNKELGLRA